MATLSCVLMIAAMLVQDQELSGEASANATVIVLPDDASATLRRTADEVAAYLSRMTGVRPDVVPEQQASAKPRIDIGRTRHAQKYLPDDLLLEDERIVVRSVPDGIVICGGSDRGTMYAAYRFLEALGCRWLTPEPEHEQVPQIAAITPDNLNIDKRPAFSWRLFKSFSPQLEQWGMKMGFNGLYPPQLAAVNGGSYYWPRDVHDVHTFAQIMPASRYFDDHPEWYSMLDGKRVAATIGSQLCVSSQQLIEEFSANVIRVFDADLNAKFLSISPNDGYGWCECAECRGLDQRLSGGRTTRQGLAEGQVFVGDRVFWFANEVAQRVSRKHPDRKLLVLSYINYTEPPDTIRPADSLVPFICHYAPADYSRPVADSSSTANRQFDELLHRWLDITPDVMLYGYVSKSMWWRLPRPVLEPMCADLKYYHQLGVHRYYCQSSLSDWALDGPLYYVIARLLWEPAADPQAIADEWTQNMFGPAAAEMKTYYAAVRQSVVSTGASYSDDPLNQVPGLFDRVELDQAMAALVRAEQIPCSGSVRARVAEVAAIFRHGYWMTLILEQERLGDPPFIFWLTLGLCCVAAMACVRAMVHELAAKTQGQKSTPAFWLLMFLILLSFGLNKYADLQSRLIDVGRQLTQSQGWYQNRQSRMLVFGGFASAGGLTTLGGIWWLARARLKQNLPAILGLSALCGIVFVRATSFDYADHASGFHLFDAAFRESCYGISCVWIAELGGLFSVAAGAVTRRVTAEQGRVGPSVASVQ